MHQFTYPDFNYRANKNATEKSLAQALNNWVNASGHSTKMFEATIIKSWEEISGKTIAKHTQNIYLNNRVLHLSIVSAPLRNELLMNKEKLISLVNNYLKYPFLLDIVFR